jgi:hypothetical protein
MFGLRELCDVIAGILERDKLAAGQRDRIVEGAGSSLGCHQANGSALAGVNFK